MRLSGCFHGTVSIVRIKGHRLGRSSPDSGPCHGAPGPSPLTDHHPRDVPILARPATPLPAQRDLFALIVELEELEVALGILKKKKKGYSGVRAFPAPLHHALPRRRSRRGKARVGLCRRLTHRKQVANRTSKLRRSCRLAAMEVRYHERSSSPLHQNLILLI